MAFIIKQKTANGRYSVHLATSVHRPGKTPCHTRQHLGTLDPLTGELLLARDLPEPSDLVRGLLAKKGISYLGRRGLGPGRGPRASPTPRADAPAPTAPASVRLEELGRPGVLYALVEAAGLPQALREAFGPAPG